MSSIWKRLICCCGDDARVESEQNGVQMSQQPSRDVSQRLKWDKSVSYSSLSIENDTFYITVGNEGRCWNIRQLDGQPTEVFYASNGQDAHWKLPKLTKHQTMEKLVKEYLRDGVKVETLHITQYPKALGNIKMTVDHLKVPVADFDEFSKWLKNIGHNQFESIELGGGADYWKFLNEPMFASCRLWDLPNSSWDRRLLNLPNKRVRLLLSYNESLNIYLKEIIEKFLSEKRPIGTLFVGRFTVHTDEKFYQWAVGVHSARLGVPRGNPDRYQPFYFPMSQESELVYAPTDYSTEENGLDHWRIEVVPKCFT